MEELCLVVSEQSDQCLVCVAKRYDFLKMININIICLFCDVQSEFAIRVGLKFHSEKVTLHRHSQKCMENETQSKTATEQKV